MNNDENVMRKLTDMSHGYAEATTTSVANTSLRTAAPKIADTLDLLENSGDYRREPKGVDGNSVQTRRIDLRATTNEKQTKLDAVNEQPESLEVLLKSVLNTLSSSRGKNQDFFDQMSDGSSSSDEEFVGKDDLWIERYRKQKLAQK